MRFLLNMNVPRSLAVLLAARGHLCRHVGDIGMSRATDEAILQEARMHQEVVVTHDLDYGHLLALSGESAPSVVIFRLRNTHPENLFAQMMKVWAEIEEPLRRGAIVVLEDAALRVRLLPIVRDR
ncbi:MAG: DUF5615 family PIN-like protein [Anaerolineae bacterium]